MNTKPSFSQTHISRNCIAPVPICVTIAGSDSGGGAGIQADLKTFSALGVYGASVISAVTAQNTHSVTAVHDIPPQIVSAQISSVFSDLDVSVVKIGMVSVPETIRAISTGLAEFSRQIIVDPVMVAKSGDRLLSETAISALRNELIPISAVLTPNLPEAACLLGMPEAQNGDEVIVQGRALLKLGAKSVLMKGGHAEGEVCTDFLIRDDEPVIKIQVPRILTKNTHGTGCTLSSALAAGLAHNLSLVDAFHYAHTYLHAAISRADQLQIGSGHGPVHHFHNMWEQT